MAARQRTLFRSELEDARANAWLGRVILIRPLSFTFLAMAAAAFTIALGAFFYFGEYTRKARVTGMLAPARGHRVPAALRRRPRARQRARAALARAGRATLARRRRERARGDRLRDDDGERASRRPDRRARRAARGARSGARGARRAVPHGQ